MQAKYVPGLPQGFAGNIKPGTWRLGTMTLQTDFVNRRLALNQALDIIAARFPNQRSLLMQHRAKIVGHMLAGTKPAANSTLMRAAAAVKGKYVSVSSLVGEPKSNATASYLHDACILAIVDVVVNFMFLILSIVGLRQVRI